MTLSVETAKAVLITAKEHDVYEPAIPTDEDKLVEQAEFVLEQANQAYNSGIKGKAVTAVKFAADVDSKPVLPEVDGLLEEGEGGNQGIDLAASIVEGNVSSVINAIVRAEQEGDWDLIREIRSIDVRKTVKKAADAALESEDAMREHDDGFEENSGIANEPEESESASPWSKPSDEQHKSKFDEKFEAEEFARAQAKKLNLPLPERLEDVPVPSLDRDVASLSIEELSHRLNDASLCLSAAIWQTALAQIEEEHAKRVANHYYNKELRRVAPDAKNRDAAAAQAEENETVIEWRNKEAQANAKYVAFRSLKELYKGQHDTISRIFAMKQEDRKSF